jgi:diguanylate cyclase (GGDEF)-like protein/PAS domain S-box-containing protein
MSFLDTYLSQPGSLMTKMKTKTKEIPKTSPVPAEDRLRTILDSIEDGYFEVDLSGNVIFCNRANARLFNYRSPEEIIGLNYREFTDSDNANKVFEVFSQVYQTGIPHKGFVWVLNSTMGEKFFVDTSVSLILDPEGEKIGFRGILRDISQQKQAEAALRASEEKYRNILESIQEGYYEVDLKGNYVFFNEAFADILGIPESELQGMNFKEFFDEEGLKKIRETFNEVFKTGDPTTAYGWEITRRDGSKRFLEISVTLRKEEGGRIIGFKGMARDVSNRKWSEMALLESEAKYRTLFEAAQSAIFLVRDGQYIDCNSHTLKIFNCTREQIIGKSPLDVSPAKQPDGRDSREIVSEWNKSVLAGEAQCFHWKHIRMDGTPFDAEIGLNRIEIGGELFIQAIVRDITDEKRAEEALKTMSLVDDLTGLYNRRGFLTLAVQEIKSIDRMKQKIYLIYVDLDDLKHINDTFGHLAGDKALIDTAHILRGSFRGPDILARIGGDEFVILAKEGSMKGGPDLLLERVRRNIKIHNEKTKNFYRISLSMGTVAYDPDQPIPLETLLIEADTLMYRDKQRKKQSQKDI